MEQTRITLANGIALDVADCGPRDAPALIFLHGFPENHRTWRHQIAHFSDRFRCIAPDQRGYRGSSKPPLVEDYTPDKLIGDIFLLADALGIADFTIIGHDWGGAIAWGVALGGQMTGRVSRVVIADAPHPALFQKLLYTNPVQRMASQYMRAFRDPAHDANLREEGLEPFLRREINWGAADRMEPDERALLMQDWQDGEAAIAMLNWYRASTLDIPLPNATYHAPEHWTPPTLPQLTIPALVLWGQDDLALPPVNLAGLDAIIDELSVVEVPECGHFIPWEAPESVNAAMDEFLQRTV
ncbi:alpha/beta fold hydrolase [Qipengyuania marisflavi]|uniref:Alpha/beta hydrolase n=1 Tax=Qipengyuania marisflavi TaxID=2486356 RepID=A0A5S3PCF8_9SPHN|nr:alpha/beta hydrolase [Qipengyuania marisflavi]TMM48929.1 alpha/beta hydrolase [Qipengyuania marisflavi]